MSYCFTGSAKMASGMTYTRPFIQSFCRLVGVNTSTSVRGGTILVQDGGTSGAVTAKVRKAAEYGCPIIGYDQFFEIVWTNSPVTKDRFREAVLREMIDKQDWLDQFGAYYGGVSSAELYLPHEIMGWSPAAATHRSLVRGIREARTTFWSDKVMPVLAWAEVRSEGHWTTFYHGSGARDYGVMPDLRTAGVYSVNYQGRVARAALWRAGNKVDRLMATGGRADREVVERVVLPKWLEAQGGMFQIDMNHIPGAGSVQVRSPNGETINLFELVDIWREKMALEEARLRVERGGLGRRRRQIKV